MTSKKILVRSKKKLIMRSNQHKIKNTNGAYNLFEMDRSFANRKIS